MFNNDEFILPQLDETVKKIKDSRKKGSNSEKLKCLRDKPFWIWNKEEHKKAYIDSVGFCCFNHIVGLPIKNGTQRPLYPFQKQIYDLTMKKLKDPKRRGIWITKATGLGISEFYLRFMGWLATYDDTYAKSIMCIVTGPNIDIATDLISRLKEFFIEGLKMRFDDSVFVCNLNNVKIKAFPSGNLNAMRGLPNVSVILSDEADFYALSVQKEVRALAERYIAKSNPLIVFVSTPNPNELESLYAKMEAEFADAEQRGILDQLIYEKLDLNYEEGLGTIFTESEISAAKLSPSFDTEYNLQRTHDSGNLLLPETIKKMKELGKTYDNNTIDPRNTYVGAVETFELIYDISDMYINKGIFYDKPLFVPTLGSVRIMGIDGAFGSSNFGICVVELLRDEIIRVLYSEEFNRIDFNSAISRCENLIKFYNIKRVYIDSANPEVVGAIRKIYNEGHDYHLDQRPRKSWSGFPVSFASEGRPLLAKLQRIATMEKLAIHPDFNELIIQLGMSKHKAYDLQKTGKVQLDSVDALRLALKHFTFE